MPHRCAFGCADTGNVMHLFPNPVKFPERFKAWVNLVGYNLETLTDNDIYKKKRICDIHFTDEHRNRFKRLNTLAMPTLYLSGESHGINATAGEQTAAGPSFSHPTTTLPSPSTQDTKMAPLLYKMDASPPANAVRVLADIIGLELDVKDINFSILEHKSPEHLKRNPMGTIPMLQDGDFFISESHATIKYLLAKYGGNKTESLYPSDLRTRALVDQCLFFDTGIFFIRFKVVALPAALGELAAPTDKHLADIEEAYGVVEAYLGKNQYLAADHLTIADISVGATAVSMQPILKLDAVKFPRTAAWLSRLEEEPSFNKILFPGAEILGKFLDACWKKNK